MSSGSVITSPRLTPIRYSIQGCLGSDWLRSLMCCRMITLHRAASTGLSKIAMNPSAVILTSLPWCWRILGSMSSRSIRFIRRRVSSSSVGVAEARPEISPTTTAARRQGTDCRGMPPFDPNSRISAITHLTINVSDYVLWSIDNHELTRSGHPHLVLQRILTNLPAPVSAPIAILENSFLGDRANRSRAPSTCYARLICCSRRKGRSNIFPQGLSQSVPHAQSWQAHLRRRQHRLATNSASDRLAAPCESR